MNKILITAALIAASAFSAKAQCKCFSESTPLEVWKYSKKDSIESIFEPSGDQFIYTIINDQLLIEGESITVDSITTEGDKKTIIYGEFYKMQLTIYYNDMGEYEGHRFKEVK